MDRDTREFFAFVATILAFGVAVMCCLFAGVATLAGSRTVVANFEAWGLPDWSRIAVGLIEVVGAVTLLIPFVNFFTALVLMALFALRVVMGLREGEAPWLALAAFLAVSFIAYRFRPERAAEILAEDPDQLA
ncbi:DoxX family protein [Tundrisphaera sp. TA3]|uniref:DoxX family protein n=1 Tax=Tundrisphaera sp. TA3 TaxID=3435775 RepID=UPI003EBFB405